MTINASMQHELLHLRQLFTLSPSVPSNQWSKRCW